MTNRTLAARLLGEVIDALPHEPEARRVVEQAAAKLLQADEQHTNLVNALRTIAVITHAVGPITIPRTAMDTVDPTAPIQHEHDRRTGSIRIWITPTTRSADTDQRQESAK